MRRPTPLNVAAGLVVAALAAALVAAGAGAGAATHKPAAAKTAHAGAFRQALAAKLGEQLHKPAADVLAAMKTAHRAHGPTSRARRAARLQARARALLAGPRRGGHGAARRAQKAIAKRDAWAAAVAQPLGVDAAAVTAALRVLVAQRLDSLLRDGWLGAGRRAAELACFDDASRCAGVGRPPGLALLRAGL